MDIAGIILIYLYFIAFLALFIIWNNSTTGKPKYFTIDPYTEPPLPKCS